MVIRSIIDSVALTLLEKSFGSSSRGLTGWSSVQCAIFQLASACVTTPWSDGSTTSIVAALKRSAVRASFEEDEAVILATKEAHRICDMFGVPRAPPLIIVSRSVNEGSNQVERSAPKLIGKIQVAHEEAAKDRAAMEEAERTKLKQKRQRETEKEEANKRKREARTKKSGENVESPQPNNDNQSAEKQVQDEQPKPSAGAEEELAVAPFESHEKRDIAGDPKNADAEGCPGGQEGEPIGRSSTLGSPTGEKKGHEDMDDDFPEIVVGGPDDSDDD